MTRKTSMQILLLLSALLGTSSVSVSQEPEIPTSQPATEMPTSQPATAIPADADATAPQDTPAAPEGRYAVVRESRLRARSGPHELSTPVTQLDRGDVVRVLSNKGAWTEIGVPGGVPVYVRKGLADKSYIEDSGSGEGRVLVNDLLLRISPNVEAGNLGKVNTGATLTILESLDGWYRVQAPETAGLWIPSTSIDDSSDQTSLERDYSLAHQHRSNALLESMAKARAEAKRKEDMRRFDDRLSALNQRYNRAMKTPDDEREWETIRIEFQKFADECPPEFSAHARAQEKVVAAGARVDEARTLRETSERIAALESQVTEQNQRYMETLEEYRIRKSQVPEPQKKRYLDYGIGHLRKDILSELGDRPVYTLEKGGQRHYFLVSSRYDLDDYLGKAIGIVEGAIEDEPVAGIRTVRVTRLEILD